MSDVQAHHSNGAHGGQEGTGGDGRQFLTFTIGGEEYGVDIMLVREVKGWSETTRLPNSPEFMRGVLNLRGVIIPIFDMAARFGLGLTNATDLHVIIIMAVGDRTIGILVDGVSDILTVGGDEIKPAPNRDTGIDDQFVDGLIAVQDHMVVLLNMQQLLAADIDKAINIAGTAGKTETKE